MEICIDRTTGNYLLNEQGVPMTPTEIERIIPRHLKPQQTKKERSKSKAEVYTPSWLCNEMNNQLDKEWFGRDNVFNTPQDKSWTTTPKIEFSTNWQDYVRLNVLEITCGEGAFLVSVYDTTTGATIEVPNRIGILDRKLRVVCEKTHSKVEWLKWAKEAYKHTYGYEYQADSLIICRKNLLQTFIDYYEYKFNSQPDKDEVATIIDIITWNVIQMDGLKYTIPHTDIYAKTKDWAKDEIIRFVDIVEASE